MIGKYRLEKTVKAVQYKGGEPSKDVYKLCDTTITVYKGCIDIDTIDGIIKAYKGDWIIKDADNTIDVVTPLDFKDYKEIK